MTGRIRVILKITAPLLPALLCLMLLPKAGGAADGHQPARTNEPAEAVLPVLNIVTETGELPGDDEVPGILHMSEPDESGKTQITSLPIRIRVRGNTSRRFPKKSYKMEITDENGKKMNFPLAGLREDDDWILNPMYSDSSKIREPLAMHLWDLMNSCGQSAAGSGGAYAEVYFNDEYHGLYYIEERVDRKQTGADKKLGILYKMIGNARPTPEELLNTQDSKLCGGFEIAWRGRFAENPFAPAADYISWLDHETDRMPLSAANTIDYGLFAAFVQARDGHFKNQYINCVPSRDGYTLFRIPWDLNHTFGDLWDGTSEETNYLTWRICEIQADDAFAVYLENAGPSDKAAVRERWRELRAGAISEESILAWAHDLFDSIYPAVIRDAERWPEGGTGDGNAANIRDIEAYIRAAVPAMDAFVENL